MARKVDDAMSSMRPAKQAIRERLWLPEIRLALERVGSGTDRRLYLTLPGREARDLDLLVSSGLLALTKLGQVSREDAWKVVAVENSKEAVVELKIRYPGLQVFEAPVHSLLHGPGFTTFPVQEHKQHCQAAVVNLDLDEPLRVMATDGSIKYPVLDIVHKFAILQADPSPRQWTLLLTLHGELNPFKQCVREVSTFLSENCEREKRFRTRALDFLGEALFARVVAGEAFAEPLPFDEAQRLIAVFVPKRLSQIAITHGWRVDVKYAFLYGGEEGTAPMVTWAIDFIPDPASSATPDRVYRSGMLSIFKRIGKIAEDGSIQA